MTSSVADNAFFMSFQLQLEKADSIGLVTAAVPNCTEIGPYGHNPIPHTLVKTSSMLQPVSMRRATSYCGAQTQTHPNDYECCDRDVADILSSGTTITAKHRHLL